MKKPLDTPPTALGSIHADEVGLVRLFASRLGWGQKEIRRAEGDGLAMCRYGRSKYTTGRAVLEFVEGLMRQQAERQANGDQDRGGGG